MPNRQIVPIILLLLYVNAPQAAPEWIVTASNPGPDTPPAGQSRFDQLFRDIDGGYRIPYPFDLVIEFLEARIDNGGEPAVREVFVPIGRSLQRDSPAPDYFRFPRRVIAIQGEPVAAGNAAGLAMDYRLFVAHQPRTDTLEVISYNDAAGRFEFQLIGDYDGNRKPRARPASRVMCMSCHHNAAPIFARNPWSETSFNVAVAQGLAEALPERFGSMIEVVTLDAGIVDLLAERANYLAAAQFVWRQGCASIACRAAMLRAILQYRLSGNANFERDHPGYRVDYVGDVARNWDIRWPRGLALAGSRIEDRDPFAPGDAPDPLLPRPPQASWRQVDDTLAAGIVFRLGGYFTLADIRRLDRRLIRLAEAGPASGMRYRAECHAPNPDSLPLLVVCGAENGPRELRATLEIDSGSRGSGSLRVVSLALPRDPDLLQPGIVASSVSAHRIVAQFGDPESGLSQRLANGDRVLSMTLSWNRSPARGASRLEILVNPEFHFLDTALKRLLAERPSDPTGSLAGGVFSRESVLRPLMRELGMTPLDWFETGAAPEAPAPGATLELHGGLALLEPYCAHCHAGSEPNPPGFLSADAPAGVLARCTPRMLARLLSWKEDPARGRSPMPPPASIGYSGTSADLWPSSDHFRGLVSSLENLLNSEYGTQAADGFRQAEYDELPSCVEAFSE